MTSVPVLASCATLNGAFASYKGMLCMKKLYFLRIAVTLLVTFSGIGLKAESVADTLAAVASSEAADTLNILAPAPRAASQEELAPGLSVHRRVRRGKVEGTLTYRKGIIYTSDNQPISVDDASLYFSPEGVKIYRRNARVFSSGRDIMGFGLSAGLVGSLGAAAETARQDYDAGPALAAGVLVAVVMITPCSVISVLMMIKGKARMKKLVRQYNAGYLFAE